MAQRTRRLAFVGAGVAPRARAPVPPEPTDLQVTSLTLRRAARLPVDSRQLPVLGNWDQLLNRSRKESP